MKKSLLAAHHTSLTHKLSLMVMMLVLAMLLLLGSYFLHFLNTYYYQNTQTKIQHGYDRLESHIHALEDRLTAGLRLAISDTKLIASIELINHYQTNTSYNAFLLDEEKKEIARALLSNIKFSFNTDSVIYNHQGLLIAAASQTGLNNFRSYYMTRASGENQIFTQLDGNQSYLPIDRKDLPDALSEYHVPSYAHTDVFDKSYITLQHMRNGLVIKAHHDIVNPLNNEVVGHIEMSKTFDQTALSNMAREWDLAIIISDDPRYEPFAKPLDHVNTNLPLQEQGSTYIGAVSIPTRDGPLYFVTTIEKESFESILTGVRLEFLGLLFLIGLATLISMRVFIERKLARPLDVLMHQIGRIENRNYTVLEPIQTGDELEIISKSVNSLAEAVREREDSLEESREKLQYRSTHDFLTDLPNRRLFEDRLEHAIALAARKKQRLALFFLDLDHFKLVNDTLGHDVGDQLLTQVSQRLQNHIRNSDTLARIGGDEFNVLVENAGDLGSLEVIVRNYVTLFEAPFICGEHSITTTVSIGVSLYPDDGDNSISLIKNADMAMYKSKEVGRNTFSFFSNSMSEKIHELVMITKALEDAIKEGNQFELYYQPKIALSSGQVGAVEALIRWTSPTYGFMSPAKFIPLAEDNKLIIPLGKWILEQACSDFMRLRRSGIFLDHISVNVSNVQMQQADLFDFVKTLLNTHNMDPKFLEIEITESYIATNVHDAISALQNFRDLGVSLAVDDFGTGYSSMSYLMKLPVTRMKIDKSFVDGVPHDKDSVSLTRAIVTLSKNCGLEVTAEGVESEEQLCFLEQEGCDEIQGYFYSKPLTFDDLVKFCQTGLPQQKLL